MAEGTATTLETTPRSQDSPQRRRVDVRGVVQGVGFRPFVYGLATRLRLTGFVGNNSHGVFIEVEGDAERLDKFMEALASDPPPLAHIESVATSALSALGDTEFIIVHSRSDPTATTLISPDLCICEDCLRELLDPDDRRYRYPFINCTNCGPRFTITRDIPYDRPLTTMADFPMCPDCQHEYEDPLDRRFHAQPNACALCGPRVAFEWCEGPGARGGVEDALVGDEAVLAAQAALADGNIVAVKGLGGFHFACDASNDQALGKLRERKGRVDKPFAVMARDIETVLTFAQLDDQERTLITSRQRPIVLLRKRPDSPLSDLVAPGNNYIGVMLPYTPLHVLLFEKPESAITQHALRDMSPRSTQHAAVLVMTSANRSNEPIARENDDVIVGLPTMADAVLAHNRDIHIHCDDSVVRVFEGSELPIRRSRGYAPFPVKLPFQVQPILAVGGELKATFCLTRENHAFMSQHIGDMENLETLTAFERAVDHFQSIFRVEPQVIACDKHPGYLSTRWAQEHAGERLIVPVQHHHAHIASAMAEHGLGESEAVIGFSFDGTGYGDDGAIWGGEVMLADYHGYERLAHLKYVPLPGGDAAVKRPYRTALAQLWAAGVGWEEGLPPVDACPPLERGILLRQLETGLNSVDTSSMGRLFDAVAALAGARRTVTYEAQAAIEFEAQAAAGVTDEYRFEIIDSGECWQFDAASVIREIVADLQGGVGNPVIAAKFHNGVAGLIEILSLRLSRRAGVDTIVLSGGVFQNATLLGLTMQRLQPHDLRVLVHRKVPPNDGGLALGQAVIAHFATDERRS